MKTYISIVMIVCDCEESFSDSAVSVAQLAVFHE